MNKSERLNDMLRYLNNMNEFNLKDIMIKYNISKSTALRDIKSLEELGLPIYSEPGRYGKYGVLKNKLLSPILFNVDEVLTLYFSMQTINDYQSTPFHIQIEKLNSKFKNCLSDNLIEQIDQMKNVLQFHSHPHHNSCKFLDKVLMSILNERSSSISYFKSGTYKDYKIKFFKISAKFGQWYANGFDLEKNQFRVFRCDKIQSFEKVEKECVYSVDSLNEMYLTDYESKAHIKFKIEIDERGKDIFYKENYPNMSLIVKNKNYIHGSYNEKEIDFIANYFINYGQSILTIKPIELKNKIQEKLREIICYYEKKL